MRAFLAISLKVLKIIRFLTLSGIVALTFVASPAAAQFAPSPSTDVSVAPSRGSTDSVLFFGPMSGGAVVARQSSTIVEQPADDAQAATARYAAPSVAPAASASAASGRVVSLPPTDYTPGRGLAINGQTVSRPEPAATPLANTDLVKPAVPPAGDNTTALLAAPEIIAQGPAAMPQGAAALGLEKLGAPSRPAAAVAENELVQNMMKKMALLEREKEKLRTQVSAQATGTLADLGQCAAEQNKISMLEAQIGYLQEENDGLKRAAESRAALDAAASADIMDILETPPAAPADASPEAASPETAPATPAM